MFFEKFLGLKWLTAGFERVLVGVSLKKKFGPHGWAARLGRTVGPHGGRTEGGRTCSQSDATGNSSNYARCRQSEHAPL